MTDIRKLNEDKTGELEKSVSHQRVESDDEALPDKSLGGIAAAVEGALRARVWYKKGGSGGVAVDGIRQAERSGGRGAPQAPPSTRRGPAPPAPAAAAAAALPRQFSAVSHERP